ncbi:hypothetical protein EMIT048CA2_40393 [Pseudomonas chlororaphis]
MRLLGCPVLSLESVPSLAPLHRLLPGHFLSVLARAPAAVQLVEQQHLPGAYLKFARPPATQAMHLQADDGYGAWSWSPNDFSGHMTSPT